MSYLDEGSLHSIATAVCNEIERRGLAQKPVSGAPKKTQPKEEQPVWKKCLCGMDVCTSRAVGPDGTSEWVYCRKKLAGLPMCFCVTQGFCDEAPEKGESGSFDYFVTYSFQEYWDDWLVAASDAYEASRYRPVQANEVLEWLKNHGGA
jgi:hypothetical protein